MDRFRLPNGFKNRIFTYYINAGGYLKMSLLKISENKRFLIKEDGTPFFWLADTAWELFHKLNKEEAELYLRNRKELGFNVVQAVLLAEDNGITMPNAYGRFPLLKNHQGIYDPSLPDLTEGYSYWNHVDYIIELADSMGIYIALLPTWADKFNLKWGKGPIIFNKDNAESYGNWLGERYRSYSNIVWVTGGDRPLETLEHFNIITKMAEGIKRGDKGKHLITFHPPGCTSSAAQLHNEEWLDFNMIQSGHVSQHWKNYQLINADYHREPIKPTLDAEPRYEDHPINFNGINGYYDDFDVRQAAYWAVFAGAFGHTYGHHSIWIMCTEPKDYFIMNWKDAIHRPGASQMKHLRNLIESRPFLERIPDQDLIAENYEGANHIQATRGRSYAFLYSPNGLNIKVNMGRISGKEVTASWVNPRTGETLNLGEFANTGVISFMPPSAGRGCDWVLVLDGC